MLKAKENLAKYIESQCFKMVTNNETCRKLYDYIFVIYNIPRGYVSDFVTLRKPLIEASEFEMFCILNGIEYVSGASKSIVDTYFTSQEIQTYSKAKYEVEKIKFPLVFKMVQVTYDQWIGTTTVKQIMELRKAQLINYNINAQRTMQRVIKGDKEIYKISLNQGAVDSIAKELAGGTFIPNTLTFNIPLEEESDFYFDKEKCELVINSLTHLDVSDGYHRYIAACMLSDVNLDFDYPMEIRIVNWDLDKSKTFIWQENQKTKLKKIDSDSLNMNKAANVVVTRINESPRCNFRGLISRNEGIINFSDMAMLVDWFYFKHNNTKETESKLILSTVKELIDNLNMLTEYNPDKYLEIKWSYKQLLTTLFVFSLYETEDRDKNNMCDVIDKAVEIVEQSTDKKFANKTPRKILIDEIERLVCSIM